MKKLVVIGLAMAMTAAMVNGVCAQRYRQLMEKD